MKTKCTAKLVSVSNTQVVIRLESFLAAESADTGVETVMELLISEGQLQFQHCVKPVGKLMNLVSLPRVGLQLELLPQFSWVSWYGRGPHENYPDRKTGSLLGVYSSRVESLYVPYIRPQENGNRSDVRWLVLKDSEGCGIRISSSEVFNFSALHFTQRELMTKTHTHLLQPTENVVLSLDHLHQVSLFLDVELISSKGSWR
jgi:beta-galactosidase